nr:hypothetical protein MIMGU_mgv11b022189mg [Ipomoea trifida]
MKKRSGKYYPSSSSSRVAAARAFSAMLPKGFVPPSGSSPCHNTYPNSVTFFFSTIHAFTPTPTPFAQSVETPVTPFWLPPSAPVGREPETPSQSETPSVRQSIVQTRPKPFIPPFLISLSPQVYGRWIDDADDEALGLTTHRNSSSLRETTPLSGRRCSPRHALR